MARASALVGPFMAVSKRLVELQVGLSTTPAPKSSPFMRMFPLREA
jgi:hypothetical protein